MSVELSNQARTLFADSCKNAYQSTGPDMRDCTDFVEAPGQNVYTFRRVGRIVARDRGATQTNLVNADMTHTTIPVTMQDKYASDLTDIFDQATTNQPREIEKLGFAIGAALKRQETQFVLDALDSATLAAGNQISFNGSDIEDGLLDAAEVLRSLDIGEQPVFVGTEVEETLMLKQDRFASADFAGGDKMLGSGRVRQGHYGLRYKFVGTGRAETGLSGGAGARECYMFVPSAVGLVVNLDNIARVDWSVEKASWRSSGFLKGNSIAIDPEGIIKCTIDEAN